MQILVKCSFLFSHQARDAFENDSDFLNYSWIMLYLFVKNTVGFMIRSKILRLLVWKHWKGRSILPYISTEWSLFLCYRAMVSLDYLFYWSFSFSGSCTYLHKLQFGNKYTRNVSRNSWNWTLNFKEWNQKSNYFFELFFWLVAWVI